MNVRRTFALCWILCGLALSTAWGAQPCHSVLLSTELVAGQPFEREIGSGLLFRIKPEKLGRDGKFYGWTINLVPQSSPNDDYIYPATPPLRLNGVQTLGASYGDDAKTSLGHPHQMRFLLDAKAYQRIQPLLTGALWPYNAPHPDTAGTEYLDAIRRMPTGSAEVTVLSYDLETDRDSIRRITIRVVLTAPADFKFDRRLQPKPSSCPAPD